MRNIIFKYWIITILAISGCTDPINFETEPNAGYLVVEGLVTDAPGTNRVKLSRTGEFTNIFEGGLERPVTSAVVTIIDDQNNTTDLVELSGGIYLTDSLVFRGELGRTYTLRIETSNGQVYESTPELLEKKVSFDELKSEFKEFEIVNDNNILVTREGTELLVDMTFLEGRNVFVRHSWRYAIDKRVFFDIDYINVINSNNFSQNKVNDLSILLLEKNFGSLPQEFRMEVSQFTLSRTAFNFWDALAKQRENGGSIFDAPPTRITGNIVNTGDPDEVVIGIFSAAGVTKREIRFIQ